MPGRRRLIWLPEAVLDIRRLDSFLRPRNPSAANRALARIGDAAQSLRDHPELGRPYTPAIGFRELFISFGARGYVLRYRIQDENIVIARLWHGLEDR